MTKIHFAFEGATGEFTPLGNYDTPIDSELPHRFELKDGKVVDKYNGITDEEVREIDFQAIVDAAKNHVDINGNLSPQPAPLPRDWVAPEDHVPPVTELPKPAPVTDSTDKTGGK